MVLKLYGLIISGNVQLVTVVLHEKQVPYEVVNVDLLKGAHKAPEYLEKHPFGQIPYLVRVALFFTAIRLKFL